VTVVDRVTPTIEGVTYLACDLLDAAQVRAAVDGLEDRLGAVAYVAGLPGTRPARDVLTVNFLAMREFLRAISAKLVGGAAMTVVASTAGVSWSQRAEALGPLLATTTVEEGLAWLTADASDYPIYNTTKEAAILFAKRWSAQLWAERRIRLNTVSPGPVQTAILPEFEMSMGKDILDTVKSMAGRHATPQDIAPVIEAVLSEAFGWVNGQDIQVDAGSTNAFMTQAVPPFAATRN
jgi:NAD(P)-dependent dehydrogenase (short-subunit alcohol dehydrogenase family)